MRGDRPRTEIRNGYRMWQSARAAVSVFVVCCLSVVSASAQASDTVLAKVSDETVTEGDLQLLMKIRQVPADQQSALRDHFIEELIERKLIEQFLARRKIAPTEADVDQQIKTVHSLIQRGGDDPDALLARLGMTPEKLRAALSLPMAWQAYLRMTVTDDEIRQVFREAPARWDGTELRASQILLKPETANARDTLLQLRKRVADGELSFAEAARMASQAPSAEEGGDLGFFPYRGRMPIAMADAAFALKPGEISQPFQTPFGWHLLTVTDVRRGQLSIEDARPQIFESIGRQKWQAIVATERERARIQRPQG